MARSWMGAWLGAALLAAALVLGACGKREKYSQESPEDVLKSALAMIQNGDAEQLPRLIYADSREFRSVLNRLGSLLGSLQALARELKGRFPQEIEDLRRRALEATRGALGDQEAAAAKLSAESSAGLPVKPAGGGQEQKRQRQAFEEISEKVLADPFLYLEVNAPRLSVERVSDEAATLNVDGEALLAGVIQIQKKDERWYLVLPLNLPMVASFTPQTRNEWSIIGSLVRMADGVVKDLTDDVRAGNVNRIGQLATKAGEKAFLPGAMIFVVYSKEMDVRRQRERSMRQFRARAGKWVDAQESEVGKEGARAMVDVLGKIGVERLDALVRQRAGDKQVTLPKWEGMSDADFTLAMDAWLKSIGDSEGVAPPLTVRRARTAAGLVERNLKGTIKPVTAYK